MLRPHTPRGHPPRYRGRFAPTPSGALHRGSLATALASWLDARASGGEWFVRIDDLDPPREVPGAADRILRQLERHGLEWDGPVRYQSVRADAYADAVEQLVRRGDAFFCTLSRSDLQAMGNRHPGPGVAVDDRNGAVRIRIPDRPVNFDDRFAGHCSIDLSPDGPFVIRRRDGLAAYQLACALDDADEAVTHVVRGADLLASTARQLVVLERLKRSAPCYGHLPLVRDGLGHKLSKSVGSAALDAADPTRNLATALAWLGGPPGAGSLREVLEAGLQWWRGGHPNLRHGP